MEQPNYSALIEKWKPVLDEESAGEIKDNHRRSVTATLLENQEKAIAEQNAQGMLFEAAPANNVASVSNFDPVLISLVRRAMPNLIAYDVCGVQPMNGPTGLIFAMKARYQGGSTSNREALFNEAETRFSGDSSGTHDSDNVSGYNGIDSDGDRLTSLAATGMPTVDAEELGASTGSTFNEMGFTIEKSTVTAVSRALKAEYSLELAQDLKAIHGLDAETELANILSAEILAEINREVVRTIYINAEIGASDNSSTHIGAVSAINTTSAGIFDLDTDSNGRWSVERFKGLMFQVEREANVIAQRTRRGKGNMIICSADVASALQMAGVLDYTPALNNNLNVDDTGNTFAGVLNGRFKVYIDPYSANSSATQYYVVGYKGTSPYDAGMFYCPYVPLQMVRAVGQDTFQPKIGFKTRYGLIANPFAETGAASGAVSAVNDAGSANSNRYYQRVKVTNLM